MNADLRAAWESMRHQRGCRSWPADFDQVMTDPIASRLVRLQATFLARHPGAPIGPAAPIQIRAHPQVQLQALDLKRAAAGDRDD
ncbi:hypothetical protein D8B23_12770 [Verminephrobacter aporrectodeae subsp. tuberculatae]|uniref:hypothetical protein n=1 Tax=Verminephrobacter aporrectodeae TaxID=1110389 RepID=UPI00224383DE|nr:hypothetical protein [Verminephrobacter aporrectodeae]MCW8199272.1 hypothetical protein [Verminephrobacter aporrectodeae subsp. tuberculatae]MCW8207657.1 hypothetical protein [Verminephrobacter aporrectodeae subsp. tuberculatae]